MANGRLNNLLVGIGVVAGIGFFLIDYYLPSTPDPATWRTLMEADPSAGDVLVWWLAKVRHWLVLFCVMGALAATIVPAVLNGRRASIQRLLDRVHRRRFPRDGGRDPDYRISFFVPTVFEKRLKCCYRTNGPNSKRTWAQYLPPARGDERDGDGVVGAVWAHGLTVRAPALRDRNDPDDLRRYMRDAHVGDWAYASGSWPGAALLGVPIQNADDSTLLGIMIVECRRVGSDIELVEELQNDAKICAMILEGRL